MPADLIISQQPLATSARNPVLIHGVSIGVYCLGIYLKPNTVDLVS